MDRPRTPPPPKSCPVCHTAMQATAIDKGTMHVCQRCGLTLTIAPTLRKAPKNKPKDDA